MAEDVYDIVFSGELVKNVDLASAKQNVGKLFKMDGPKLDALFSGKAIVLKRGLNFETATKYRVAIKKAGALVNVVEQKKPEAPKPSPGKAVFGEQASTSTPPLPVVEETPAPSENKVPTAPTNTATSGLSMAPVGSDMIDSGDRKTVAAVQVDTSSISVQDMGGDLLQESEKRTHESRDFAFDGMDVAPVGADVLRADERETVEAVQVDISGLSVSDVGERLSEPAPPAPPAPDVSRIQLVDEAR